MISPPLLPVAEPDLGPLEERYMLEALRSGWVSSAGPFIDRFEDGFARFCGAGHAVSVANGTVAIHLALAAARVGPGDEVIVPALTFVATASTVRHAGADPVFVDSVPGIGTMDPAAVGRALSKRTKAILPVHLYGHPADMDPILELAQGRDITVIEDAAESHGARYRGRTVGGLGNLATFSFYGNKLMTTGEGGMVVTGDAELAARMRMLKSHGMDPSRRYWHPEVGFNYRMTNIQAALGCAQLERFGELRQKRQMLVDLYRRSFAGTDISVNPAEPWAEAVPWLVCSLLPPGSTRERRDRLMAELKSAGIDSRPYFHLLCDMPPYAGCRRVSASGEGDLPVARDLSARGLNLPSITRLTPDEVSEIAGRVTGFLAS